MGASAVVLHRLPLFGTDSETVDLAAQVSRVRRVKGLRLHPPAATDAVVVADGYLTQGMAAAMLTLTRHCGVVTGLVALDAALHGGRIDLGQVSEAMGLVAPRTRPATWDRLVAEADPLCESPGETRTRVLLRDLGIADVRSQVDIVDGGRLVARVDFLVQERVIIEFDGAVKYGGDGGRAALIAEKRREDDLRRLGYVIVRLTWADLGQPGRVGQLVRQALAQAARLLA